jgi:hypothetical protein
MLSAAEVLDAYGVWLERQALASRTRSAYGEAVGFDFKSRNGSADRTCSSTADELWSGYLV